MPGVAPGAAIGAKLFWGGGGGDLVRGGGQGLALGGVFALAGYRTLCVAFGHEVFPASKATASPAGRGRQKAAATKPISSWDGKACGANTLLLRCAGEPTHLAPDALRCGVATGIGVVVDKTNQRGQRDGE